MERNKKKYLTKKAKIILGEALSLDYKEITEDASPVSYENWDSLNHVKLILIIENEIGRKMQTNEILSINSLESIKKVIAKK